MGEERTRKRWWNLVLTVVFAGVQHPLDIMNIAVVKSDFIIAGDYF
jgi:hypothetical protein